MGVRWGEVERGLMIMFQRKSSLQSCGRNFILEESHREQTFSRALFYEQNTVI